MATSKKAVTPVGKKGMGISTGAKVSVGASLTAAAVAAAGAYFLYGSKHAAKNRKKVAGWVEDAKKEVMKGLEKAKTMSEEEYKELVETVSKAHGELAKISKADLVKFQKEMKDGWKVIAKNAAGAVTAAKQAMPGAPAKKPVVKTKTPTKSTPVKKVAAKKAANATVPVAKKRAK
jgi:hypothetical protein